MLIRYSAMHAGPSDDVTEWRYHVTMKAAIMFFSLCLPAMADLAAGQQALKNGDYATAVKEFLPLAKQGNAVAQVNLGVIFHLGQGVAQDYKEALRWYRLAAHQGNAVAQAGLGVMYIQGHGVPQDYTEAARWFRLAAHQGDASAQAGLGAMYHEGLGVVQDYKIGRAHV